MASSAGQDEEAGDWVTVLTTLPTLPLPPNSARAILETERLVLRPPTADDLEALHVLRTQPEVMFHTKRGLVDDDLAMTRERLGAFLAPGDADTFNFAICLRVPGDNRLIGIGGVHLFRSSLGWPELGYMFHSAHWGKGYATEFLRGFVALYAALPRPAEPVPLRVTRNSLPPGSTADGPWVVEEKLTAVVPDRNAKSQNVVRKAGFEEFLQRVEDSTDNPDAGVLLHVFQYLPGRKPSVAS